MEFLELREAARRLYDAHGGKSEFEAAQKARICREKGALDEAADWQRIRELIAEMRAPHAS